MFLDVEPTVVGGAAIGLVLVLMLAKVPVAVCMTVPALLGLYALHGTRAAENLLGSIVFDSAAQWTLSVLPMFVLMGLLLWKSGITSAIYTAASHWLGWLPGGLGVATNVAGAGLSAVTGTSVGSTHALARNGIPEMLRRGYDRRLAVGSVAVASLSGHLIPPGILMVVYAGIAQVPVGPQLLAGIGPGILITVACCAMIVALSVTRPALAGRDRSALARAEPEEPRPTWGDRWRSALAIWPMVALIGLVLGTMFLGVFTATEAGAAGALGAVLLTFWFRRGNRPLAAMGAATAETVRSMGGIFFLLVGATALSRLLSVSGLADGFADWVAELGLGRIGFLVLMIGAYLVMGTFLESLAMLLLTVPLLLPVLESLDISPIWFGVFVVLLCEVGMLTPPVGILAFIIHGITKEPDVNGGQEISLGDIFRAITWFFPVILAVLFLLIAFPDIVGFVPAQMGE
ncbi:C4-dicarboxylate ABC transporter permease [Pseudonocardia sp. CNS-139]|nr:C4-dicarboxylate ABC transporter permease [Pseudonocardia sp. CNS-139]